jgi:hypothetical protein
MIRDAVFFGENAALQSGRFELASTTTSKLRVYGLFISGFH